MTKGFVGGGDGVKFDDRALLKAHKKADAWRLLRADRGKVRHTIARGTEGRRDNLDNTLNSFFRRAGMT